MKTTRRKTGDKGESLAAAFLRTKGFEILARNVVTKASEIDLVCREGDMLVFVEVKTRRGTEFGYPEESVTQSKRRHLAMAAHQYLQQHRLESTHWRLDAVTVLEKGEGQPEILHFEAIDGGDGG